MMKTREDESRLVELGLTCTLLEHFYHAFLINSTQTRSIEVVTGLVSRLERVVSSKQALVKQMENQDVLLQICSRLDNSTLQNLSQTTLWLVIREFCTSQHFWYLRTQHLLGRELQERCNRVWKDAYYLFPIPSTGDQFPWRILDNLLAVEIQLELGHDPSTDGDDALFYACSQGYADVIKILLSDSRVDPSDGNNDCIRATCERGHAGAVKILLDDSRVDPGVNDNYCFKYACGKSYVEIISLLIVDSRVDPASQDNSAIRSASQHGYDDVVKVLLTSERVDPAAQDNYSIKAAAMRGHTEVVKLLLSDHRVDPSAEGNRALKDAARRWQSDVVRLLLADCRVDGTVQDNYRV